MNRRKPERGDQSRRRTFAVTCLALGVALWSCVACSSGSSASPTIASTTTSAPPTSSSTPTLPSTPTKPTTSTTPTPAKPVAHCPVLKAVSTPAKPLECTSAAVIGAAAARVGLKRDGDGPTILASVYLLSYNRTVLLPVEYRREVNVYHYTNGAVAAAICSGVVSKTVDPALGVCLDLGPSTRTDRPAVRAWALRAEAVITKSAKAQPVLTSGTLTFVACSDPSFPKTSDNTIAFEMNVYVEHSGAAHASSDCAR